MDTLGDNGNDAIINIGMVARKLGISVSCIRKYEEEGLILPLHAPSGHRLFSLQDIERIRMIRFMIRKLGLNFEGIRRLQALIPCWTFVCCSEEVRIQCPARKEMALPCWIVKETYVGKQNHCRECKVYQMGCQCLPTIKKMLQENFMRKIQNE